MRSLSESSFQPPPVSGAWTPGLIRLRQADEPAAPGREQVAWLMEGSTDTALLTNPAGVIEYVNPAFELVTGYTRGEAVGQTPALLRSGRHAQEFYSRLWRTLLAGSEFCAVLVNRRKNGELYHEEKTIRPLFDAHGRIQHFLSSGRDVSQRIGVLERLTRAATHDSLTDLPNRALFIDRLDQALVKARRGGQRFAVALLDVDRFKTVNDSLGHATGDMVLRAVAQRLLGCVREVDTVARLGGDEFGLLLPGAVDADNTAGILHKIVAAFVPAVPLDGGQLPVTVSLGACLSGVQGEEGSDLLGLADAAMYGVKRRAGNGFQICGER